MTYGGLHRFLVRSLASRGVMSMTETEQVLSAYKDNANIGDNHSTIQDLVREINDKIRPFQQTVKITNDELTNEEVVIFLNLGFDDASKAQNIFNATELEYFRLLIEQIMTTEARQITGIHAINIVGQMKASFTKTDAQKLLNLWCKMRYLDKDGDNYALGVRAIHEFEGYLRQNMPDAIEECGLCKQVVFRGYNCPSCGKAIHTRCLNRYLEKVEKWPCCKADFSQDQLEQLQCEVLNNESSSSTEKSISSHNAEGTKSTSEKFNMTQSQLTTPTTTPENAAAESTLVEESEQMDLTPDVIPEISQRLTKKRKHH